MEFVLGLILIDVIFIFPLLNCFIVLSHLYFNQRDNCFNLNPDFFLLRLLTCCLIFFSMKKRKLTWLLFPVGSLIILIPNLIGRFTLLPVNIFDYLEAIGLALIVSTPFAMLRESVSKKQQ